MWYKTYPKVGAPMKEIKQIHAHSLRRSSLSVQLPLLLHKLLFSLSSPNLLYATSLIFNLNVLTLNSSLTFLLNHLLRLSSGNLPFPLTFRLFSLHPTPNPHSFTFLLSACALHRRPLAGRSLHSILLKRGHPISEDPFTATALLSMYSRTHLLDDARRLFDQMPLPDLPSWNALITGYAQAGDMLTALQLFDQMPTRNVVSWTAMVSGFAQNGMWEEAVGLFLRMWRETEVRPNAVTVASVLPACAGVGVLGLGMRVEEYARREGFLGNVFVGNALVEMYGKCGSVESAWRVFEEMGPRRRNLCTWNSMVMTLAVHGKSGEALELFREMRAQGFTPDDITFIGVLLACTHGGLVDRGKEFFRSMEKDFSIMPKLQHYGCMVDLLGRSGLLTEAYELIKSMPMEPDSVIWGALLGACSFHDEVKLAEIAAEFLFRLEPENPGNHVILSNIYASSGQWNSVAEVWKLMKKGKQQRKSAGYSGVELDGIMHKFIVEDKSHPGCQEIYLVLREMTLVMKGEEDEISFSLDVEIESYD